MVRMILTRFCARSSVSGVVDQVEVAVPQPVLHLLHAAPLVRVRLQRLGQERQLVGEDGRLAGLASCRSVPSTPIRSPRSSSCASSQPVSPTCFWPDHHLDAAGPAEELGGLVLALDLAGLAHHRPAGPVPEVEEVQLALDAPADDAAGRLDARPLRRSGRSAGRARIVSIGWWPSKRPPHGSRPSASIRRSFSSRLARGSPAASAAGFGSADTGSRGLMVCVEVPIQEERRL